MNAQTHTDSGEYVPVTEGENEALDAAAKWLHEVGQRRASERAAKVSALRIDSKHPLVLAVIERWGVEPHEAGEGIQTLARTAVQAVVNCLGSDVNDAADET